MSTRPNRRFNPFGIIVNHLKATLGVGIMVMLPIGITILVFKILFDLLDPKLRLVLTLIPGVDTCWSLTSEGHTCPGLGVVALLVLVYLAGLITAYVVGRRVVAIAHGILEAIPVVKSIYSTAHSAVQLLSAPKDQPYSGVVLLDFPSRGLKSIGLVTAHLGVQDGDEMLAVYVPTSPIPSNGYLVLVAAKEVTPTEMNVDDALKIIISGGVLAKDVYIPPSSQKVKSTLNEYVPDKVS